MLIPLALAGMPPMDVMIDYARRGRNDWWRYALTVVLAIVFTIVAAVVLTLSLMLTRLISTRTLLEIQSPDHPIAFFMGNGVQFALLLAGFALAARLIQQKRFSDIMGAWKGAYVGAGVAVWSACIVAGVLIDVAVAPQGFHWTAGPGTLNLALAAGVGLAVQTFAEEFVFRGLVTQGLLLATKRPIVAAALSGVVFGAVHIPNGWPQCVNAILFGMAAALIAIRMGGIAFTWGLHLINNLFGAIVVVSGGDVFNGTPGLFTQTTPNLMWWDVAVGVALLGVPLWLTRNVGRRLHPAEVFE